MNTPPDTKPTRILVVCTGNICRSPYAQFLLGAGLAAIESSGFEVTSAGTRAVRGHPIDPSSAALLGPIAPATKTFSASQLTADLLADQDVILTMTREHRSAVLRLRPAALRRTFSLREFARLVDTSAPSWGHAPRAERWQRLLPELAANRTSARLPDPADDDVVDPFGKSAEIFRQMAAQIGPAVERIVDYERASSVHCAPSG